MCGGYSLDETHTPEIVACLIPAFGYGSSDDYGAAASERIRRCRTRRVFAKRNW